MTLTAEPQTALICHGLSKSQLEMCVWPRSSFCNNTYKSYIWMTSLLQLLTSPGSNIPVYCCHLQKAISVRTAGLRKTANIAVCYSSILYRILKYQYSRDKHCFRTTKCILTSNKLILVLRILLKNNKLQPILVRNDKTTFDQLQPTRLLSHGPVLHMNCFWPSKIQLIFVNK